MNIFKNLLLVGVLLVPGAIYSADDYTCPAPLWSLGTFPIKYQGGKTYKSCYYNMATNVASATFKPVPAAAAGAIADALPQYYNAIGQLSQLDLGDMQQIQQALTSGNLYLMCSKYNNVDINDTQSRINDLYLRGTDGNYYFFFPTYFFERAPINSPAPVVPGLVAQANLSQLSSQVCAGLD